jgi:2-hydroxychromene-2-carboxylate isomerase
VLSIEPVVVYGDFNCPYSLLASIRLDALAEAGSDVEWRAVEHARELPVIGRRLDDAGHDELEAEIADVRRLLQPDEQYPATAPNLVPRTEAAVSAYAEAVGAGVADEVRRTLFDAYWTGHADIGSPEVLRKLLTPVIRRGVSAAFPLQEAGYAVAVNRGPITAAAYRRIRGWRDDWRCLGIATIPTLVAGSRVLAGIDALDWLARQLSAREPAAA